MVDENLREEPTPLKRYSLEEIQQLRILGTILKESREEYNQGFQDGLSLEELKNLLKQRTGKEFSRATIRRYENAGIPIDFRSLGSRSVPKEYLQCIAPLTAYPVKLLVELSRGDYDLDLSNREGVIPLSTLIANLRSRLGASRFEFRCREYALLAEDIVLAERDCLRDSSHLAALSGLLDIPVDKVRAAAIEGLRLDFPFDKLEKEEAQYTDKTRKYKTEKRRQELLNQSQAQNPIPGVV